MSEQPPVYNCPTTEPNKPPPLPPQLVELSRACIGTLVSAYRAVGVEVRVDIRLVLPAEGAKK